MWVVAGVAVIITVLRYFLAAGGSFYSDDFGLRYRAATQALNWDFVSQSYNGHVNPVGWMLAWVTQRAAPGSFLAVCVVMAVMWLVILLCLGWLVLNLTGRAALASIVVLAVSLSAFQIEVSVWWSAAIYALPYQMFAMLSLVAFVRARLDERTLWGWLGVVAYVGAGLSFTRGFLILLLIMAAVCTLPWGGKPPVGIRAGWAWGRRWWLTSVGVAVVVGAAALLRGDAAANAAGLRAQEVATRFVDFVLVNCLPAFWGGPYNWRPVPLPQGWPSVLVTPAPGVLVVVGAATLSLAGMIATLTFRPQLRTFTLFTVGWVAGIAFVASLVRVGDPVASIAYRYTFDALWPVILLISACFAKSTAERTYLRSLLVVAAAVALVVSAYPAAQAWRANLAGPYLARATSGFGSIAPGQQILPQGVPAGLVDPVLLAPYANTEVVLQPQAGAPMFADYADSVLLGFAQDGAVEEQTVSGPRSLPGPDPQCGYRITNVARSIPLDGKLIDWGFYARIAYFTGTPTSLNIASGGEITTVNLQAGPLSAVYLPVSGPGTDVLVSTGAPGVTACVTEMVVGNRLHADGQTVALVPTGDVP